jgi:pilus assembly protein FimV
LKHRSTHGARFALTGVALAAGCLWASQAAALGLGRLSVQSALGETLKAEIDVTSITPDELATLKLRVAPPEAYRAAGVEYNSALAASQVELQKRADGRQVLRVTSDRAVTEPFVDVILEATWSTGRLVREYTMLFDPPGSTRMAQAPAAPQTAPAITPAPAPAAPPPVAAAPAAPRAAPAPRPPAAEAPPRAPAPAVAAAGGADDYMVRSGDSLSRIAAKTQRPGVSLDQMLVSLFRANPDAFIGGNMNRLKAGVVLSVPSAESAGKIGSTEARETIQAQSADFSAYRQRLAAGTTTTADATPAQKATGKVQANVDDRKQAAAPTPDKLTLSQGGVRAASDARASSQAEKKAADARVAELARNVEELKKLQGATATPPAAAPAPATPPVAATPAPTPLVVAPPPPAPTPAPPPVVVAPPPPAPTPAPVAAAPTPAPVAPPKPSKPAEEPGFLSSLLENPLVLPGAGVLVVLIAGLGLYRLRGRMRKQGGETSFLESRLQPDSFFGASGGQRIDTRDAATSTSGSVSSMSYSLSQLDAIGDVDPVAEADVYLAYGRDLQAEEILKEAMRANPERMAIRLKLLEVYLKRRDTKGFELLATQVYTLTRGSGEDWTKAQELGRQIDPENPLYQPGGAPELEIGPGGKVIEPLDATTLPHTAKPSAPAFVPAADARLDDALDLDLDLGAETLPAPAPAPPLPADQTQPLQRAPAAAAAAAIAAANAEQMTQPSTIRMPAPPPPQRPVAPPPPVEPPKDMGSLDFDLGDLTLDTKPGALAPAAGRDSTLDFGDFGIGGDTQPPLAEGDPLARKLELAEEFRQIGDLEGARDLLEEVVAKADGALKNKAQGMLQSLG